ncbi:MAG: preprotein translocase subunit SecA [Spirochaetota bacterium]|nr:MAG: preprotein translocase subunit SecA [Spirochaetota bacterium]
MANPITKIFGSKGERDLKSLKPYVVKINDLESGLKSLPDEKLAAKTEEFKERLANGETLDDILIEAFAVVREVAIRTIDMRHFDVQLMGGFVLYEGKIAEMKTGEGKTLAATLPLYLIALEGKGAHLITVNDYLAKRDALWMGPIYEFLGLKVRYLYHDMPFEERKEAYQADITYGTNNEFGFDYLRDNMSEDTELMVQRGHYYAIVDEVDSVLIDEARTPLIISGPAGSASELYYELNPKIANLNSRQKSIVNQYLKEAENYLTQENMEEAGKKLLQAEKGDPRNKRLLKLKENPENIKLIQKTEFLFIQSKSISQLEEDLYFVIEEKGHSVTLTERGRAALSPSNPEKLILQDYTDRLSELDEADMPKEEIIKQKSQIEDEYLVMSERLHIINQLLRAYSLYEKDVEYVIQDGRVVIVDEFTGRLMPGRRYSEGLHQAIEAKEGVSIQRDTQTLATITIQNYFRLYNRLAGMTGTADTEAEEFNNIYKLDVVVVPTNEPVIRVDHPDRIYRTTKEKWKAIADEIEQLYNKGQPMLVGTVSVEKSELLSKILKKRGIKHEVLNARYHEKEAQIIAKAGQKSAVTIATNMAGRGTDIKLGDGVTGLGGLHVLGTERHEARRIDNQLRGRSGRQGDPGSSRFYLSLEDDLMRLFGSDKISNIMLRMGMEENQNIDSPLVTKAITSAQKKVENRNFEIRKHLLEYDNVMNDQRNYIYSKRNEFLDNENIEEKIKETLEELVDQKFEELDLPKSGISGELIAWIDEWLSELFASSVDINTGEEESLTQKELRDKVLVIVDEKIAEKILELGEEIAPQVQRFLALQSIDRRWKEHLYEMDGLREGISYQSYAQKDPLVEYKFQSFNLFQELIKNINNDILKRLFRVHIAPRAERRNIWQINRTQHEAYGQFQAGGQIPEREYAPQNTEQIPTHYPRPVRAQVVVGKKVGRNEPCPCGSGKKYKYCCGQ